jgi:C4-dicarboxylate-specific signal transduction histidine kinase
MIEDSTSSESLRAVLASAAQRQFVSAARILDAVLRRSQDSAAAKHVRLEFWIGDGGLICDFQRLVDALGNIVEGSIESSAVGGRVVVSSAVTADGGQFWTVRDPGSGKHRSLLEALGWPFHTAKAGGSGLDFADACEVFRSYGGEVHIEFERDLGTLVSIELPRRLDAQ